MRDPTTPTGHPPWTYAATRRVVPETFPVLEVHARLGSTMARAKTLAQAGAPSGTMVLADEQTAGRGRLGRRWQAPPQTGLLVSVVLRPSPTPGAPPTGSLTAGCEGMAGGAWMLGAASALALVQAVERSMQRASLRDVVALKWPNDVLVGNAKLSGVLVEQGVEQRAESGSGGGAQPWAVLGMGVNLSWAPSGVGSDAESTVQASPELRPPGTPDALPATSLEAVFGERVDRLKLLEAWSAALAGSWLSLERGETAELLASWRAHLSTLGRRVRVERIGAGPLVGVAVDVDSCGRLVVRSSSGVIDVIDAGDVLHLRSGD